MRCAVVDGTRGARRLPAPIPTAKAASVATHSAGSMPVTSAAPATTFTVNDSVPATKKIGCSVAA